MVVDKTGRITKRVEDVFLRFMRGYDLLRVEDPNDVLTRAMKESLDVILINGDDFRNSLTAEMLQSFKVKIIPPPKLLLLLEPNLINMMPALEREVDSVLDSMNFRMLQMRRVVHKLVEERFLEEMRRQKEEGKKKKNAFQTALNEVEEMCEEIELEGESEEKA